jgi:hypothetical protein
MEKLITYIKSNPLVAVLSGVAVLGLTYHFFIKKNTLESVAIADSLEVKDEAKQTLSQEEAKQTLSQEEADKLASELGKRIERLKTVRMSAEGAKIYKEKNKELRSKLEDGGYKMEEKGVGRKKTYYAVKITTTESKPKESGTTNTTVVSYKLSQADANKLASIAKGIYDSASGGSLSNAQMQSVRQILMDLEKGGYRYENGKAVPSGKMASNQTVGGTIGGKPLVVTKNTKGTFSSDNSDKVI